MTHRLDVEAALSTNDPRVTTRHLQLVPRFDTLGEVLLVGVVHDHPASIARVGHILTTIRPDSLALELPSLAVPLFERYARGDRPPTIGGEMSMAVWAAGSARSIGLDSPNWDYVRRLVGRLRDGEVSEQTLRDVLADLVGSTHQAVACRLAGFVGTVTGVLFQPYPTLEYDCTMMDSPADQADNENEHVETQQAFIDAVEIPAARTLIDELREETMADRLHELRHHGTVIAIIGVQHVEPIGSHLERLART